MVADPSTSPPVTPYDLLIKGGHVIAPEAGLSTKLDLAIANGQIAQLAQSIPPEQAAQVIDASGCYVTPGLIDMHVHIFPHDLDTNYSLVADGQSFSSCVTTMVDAGTAGPTTFGDFKEHIIDASKTRVLAYLNVVDLGMSGPFEQDVSRMDPVAAGNVASGYPDLIVGIKCAHYWTWQPYDAQHAPWDNVERAVAAGDICGKPVMVDFWPRPPERSYEDLLMKKLRPGDVHTHVFGQHFPVLDEEAKLNPVYAQARERGIVFDVGHGAGSFWFRNAIPAIQQGFVPDTMGTDLHRHNAATGLVVDLANVMSKFLNMGVPLEQVVEMSTSAPAREIGHPELGTLQVGAEADVAVFRVEDGEFGFTDCGRAKLIGSQRIVPELTLRAGEVVFDANGMSMPVWTEAPPAYWVCKQPGPR